MKILIISYGKILAKLLFTGCMLFFVFRQIPFSRLISLIESAHIGYIILGGICFIASKIFSSMRQLEILKNQNLSIDKSYNHKLYLLGMFYNTFLPGGIGGDGYKIIKIERDYRYAYKDLVKVVFLDRVSGLTALCNIAVLLLISMYPNKFTMLFLLAAMFINAGFYFIINKKMIAKIYTKKTEALSWLVQIAQCISACFILLSLDIQEHMSIYIFVFLLSSVSALFPFTIGGLGAREYTFLFAASYFSIDAEKAVCVGLLFYLISLLVSFFGIYYVFKSIIKTSGYVSS